MISTHPVFITSNQITFPSDYRISSEEKERVCHSLNTIFEKWHARYPSVSPETIIKKVRKISFAANQYHFKWSRQKSKIGGFQHLESKTCSFHFPCAVLDKLLHRPPAVKQSLEQQFMRYILENSRDPVSRQKIIEHMRSLPDEEALEDFRSKMLTLWTYEPFTTNEEAGLAAIAHEIGHLFFAILHPRAQPPTFSILGVCTGFLAGVLLIDHLTNNDFSPLSVSLDLLGGLLGGVMGGVMGVCMGGTSPFKTNERFSRTQKNEQFADTMADDPRLLNAICSSFEIIKNFNPKEFNIMYLEELQRRRPNSAVLINSRKQAILTHLDPHGSVEERLDRSRQLLADVTSFNNE